jgi:hypothetical protein
VRHLHVSSLFKLHVLCATLYIHLFSLLTELSVEGLLNSRLCPRLVDQIDAKDSRRGGVGNTGPQSAKYKDGHPSIE